MKQKKTYFMHTFQVIINILIILLLLILSRLAMSIVERILLENTSGFMIQYTEYVRLFIEKIISAFDVLTVTCFGIVVLLVTPELFYRIAKDSVYNWMSSIYYTLRIRKFISGSEAYMQENDHKKVALNKSIIDVKDNTVTYVAKLSNDMQAHKKYIEMKDILYKEIVNLFPDYSFSQIERYQHWVKVDGTKIKH